MIFLDKKEGSIFFIPLFLPAGIKDNRKNYTKYNFTEGLIYAFGRLIKEDKSSGDLIEVFTYTGPVPADESIIIKSGLLAKPFHVAMAFSTERWRFIFENKSYDKNADSDYKDITFLLGTEDDYELWKGGNKSRISNIEAQKYKPWIIHHPTRIEESIRNKDVSAIT